MRAELSPAEVDDLIREALGEARTAVRGRLRARFESELEARVEERLAPREAGAGEGVVGARGAGGKRRAAAANGAPGPAAAEADPAAVGTATGTGIWLYGITAQGDAPAVPGVADGHAPRSVGAAGLVALVSTVPLTEFGEAGLKRNLNDMQWLERTARAHERVLEAALTDGPVVPMRMCTIYRHEDQVKALLGDRTKELSAKLDQLRGRNEWGVKVTADRDRIAATLRERVEHRPAGSGGAYLGRRQRDLQLRDETESILDAAVRDSHSRLEEWAAAARMLPAQRQELSGREGEMVMNAAYLVDDERLDGFRGVVEELAGQYCGLEFELTGPWPPFNFSGEPA